MTGVGTWLMGLKTQITCTPRDIAVPFELAEALPLLDEGQLNYWRTSFQLVFGREPANEQFAKSVMLRHQGLQRMDAFLRQSVKAYREEQALRQQVHASGVFGAALRQALEHQRKVRRQYQERREVMIARHKHDLENLKQEEEAALPQEPTMQRYFAEAERTVEELKPAEYMQLIEQEIAGNLNAIQFKERVAALKAQHMENWVRTNVSDAEITAADTFVNTQLNH
jgi:hypothetical protein